MDEYTLENETDSVMELIVVGLFCILGFSSIVAMVVTFVAHLNKYERFDKVSASAQYEEAAEHTYKFTPYQAYMMGYNIDPWGPDGLSLTWYASSGSSGAVELSVPIYNSDLVIRNNMISGANGMNPSVRSVLDSMSGGYTTPSWYRNGLLHLNWTNLHSVSYDEKMEDNLTVIEYGKRDFKWILER